MADKRIGFTLNCGVSNTQALTKVANQLSQLNDRVTRLQSNFSKTGSSVNKVAQETTKASSSMSTLSKTGTNATNKIENGMTNLASSIYVFKNIAQSVKEVTNAIDEMSMIQSRMRLMNDGLMTTDELTEKIYQTSQATRGSFSSTADMVAKLGLLAGDAFKNNQEIVDFAEQLNKQMKIAGTDTIQAKSAMLQLTQALGSGRLQGDELRSIMETMPTIIQSIADELDVPKGKVKDLASEGKVSAEVLKNAVLNSADEINKKFESIPMTFGQAMTLGMNNIQKGIMDITYIFNNMLSQGAFGNIQALFQGIGQLIQGIMLGFISAMAGIFQALSTIFSPLASFIQDIAVKFGLAQEGAMNLANSMKVIGIILGLLIAAWVIYKSIMVVVDILSALWGLIMAAAGGSILAIIALIIAALLIIPFIIGLIVGDWRTGIAYMVATVVAFGEAVKQIFLLIVDTVVNIVLGLVFAISWATMWLAGQIVDALFSIVDFVMGACDWIHNIFGGLGLAIQGIWEKLVGMIQNAFGGMLDWVLDKMESFINMCIDGINKVIKALNKIPKVDIGLVDKVKFGSTKGWGNDNLATGDELIARGTAMMNKKVDWSQFSKGDDFSTQFGNQVVDAFDGLWQTNADWSQVGDKFNSTVDNVMDWFNKPQDEGDKFNREPYVPPTDNKGSGGKGSGGKLPSTSVPKVPSSVTSPLGQIANNTGAIKDSVSTGEQDLKYLLDIAKRDFTNRYSTTEIKIDMTNNNTISSDQDIDGIVGKLNDKLREQLKTSAEGVHY